MPTPFQLGKVGGVWLVGEVPLSPLHSHSNQEELMIAEPLGESYSAPGCVCAATCTPNHPPSMYVSCCKCSLPLASLEGLGF